MELINRDKLDDYKFRSASERMDLSVEYMSGWNDAIDHIQINAPRVDAEPVIRCKDCKHWNEYYRECDSPNWDTGTDDCFVVPAGFYCGWAERRGK